MIRTVLALLIFVPTLLFAESVAEFQPREGEWLYNGQHFLNKVTQFSTVNCATEGEACPTKHRLVSQGYQCFQRPSDIFLCAKDIPLSQAPDISDELVQYYGAILKLYTPVAAPELTLDTTYLKQYFVEQKAVMVKQADDDHHIANEVVYGDYGNYIRIYIHDKDRAQSFIFEKDDTEAELKMHQFINIGSKEHYTRFSTTLVWEPQAP